MKKWLILLLALLLPCAALAETGDLNGNGAVDVGDAWLILRHVAQGAKVDGAADLNGDGVIDWRDVLLALQGATGMKLTPPSPGNSTGDLSVRVAESGMPARTLTGGGRLTLEAVPLLAGARTCRLQAVHTKNGDVQATWQVKDTALATITADGTLTCKGIGQTTVTATAGKSVWEGTLVLSADTTYTDTHGYTITFHAEAAGGGKYTLSANAIQFVSPVSTVTVPNLYAAAGIPVTGIGEDFMAGNTHVTAVYLPATVLTISDRAFKGCTALKIMEEIR